MEIRQIKEAEVAKVLDLIDGYERPQAPRPSVEEQQAIYASILQSGGCILGAFPGGYMIGTCTVNLCPNLSWSGRPYAIIENVIVSKAHRNQGFGKALLQCGKEFAQRAGWTQTPISSLRNISNSLSFCKFSISRRCSILQN